MITAVDTSVLIDVLAPDPEYGRASLAALRRCLREGRLLACEIVWAELSGFYDSFERLQEAMSGMSVEYSPLLAEAAVTAGLAWSEYRARGGPRVRVLPDFLIGGHALQQADRLLTRDARFHRIYLPRLKILDPTGGF